MSAHPSDELLSAHVDSMLGAAELAEVTDHLRECAGCRRRLDLVRATAGAVAGLPDELPVGLDLGFLQQRKGVVVALPPRAGWQPPRWAVPVAAAAAALVVGFGAGTLGSRPSAPGASSGVVTTSQQQRIPPFAARGNDGTGQTLVPAAPSAAAGALPGLATTQRVDRAERAFVGGATVTVTPSNPNPTHGQGVQLTLTVVAGSTGINARGLQLTAGRGTTTAVVAGSGGQVIAPGESATLYATWVAGQLGDGSPTAGRYTLTGRVVQADGTDLVVTLELPVG